MRYAVSGVGGFLALLLVIVVPISVSTSSATAACLPEAVTVEGAIPTTTRLDAEQRANATTIVSAVVARRLPTRAAVIAVAAALQESSLRNLPHGDLDSLGLFQQRPSQGWGSPLQILDPTQATHRFLDRLVDVPAWTRLPLTEVAQAVQRSATPDAYARWENTARTLVNALLGRPAPTTADNAGDAVDTPGLLVLGDKRIDAGIAWPSRFQGGPVTVDALTLRTTRDGLAALRAARATLPGTVLLSLGANDPRLEQRQFARRIQAVLAAVGPDRTVYWLVDGDQLAGRQVLALQAAAASSSRLHLIELPAPGERGPPAADALNAALRESGLLADPQPLVSPLNAGCADGFNGFGAVPVDDCAFLLPRANPRPCQDAVRWALARIDGPAQWYRRCLNFVARAYGYEASGVPTAALFWNTAAIRHLDPNPPAGALVFWDTGDPAGHVALAAGGDMVLSNDIGGAGTISLARLSDFSTQWGARYLGWSPPFFPHGI